MARNLNATAASHLPGAKKRHLSAASRRKMALAQKKRWNGQEAVPSPAAQTAGVTKTSNIVQIGVRNEFSLGYVDHNQ
jgi:hypothetical protein